MTEHPIPAVGKAYYDGNGQLQWCVPAEEYARLEAENAQLRAQIAAPNKFREWWTEDGRFLDPDTEDVPWFYKREALAEYAFDAGIRSLDRLITKLRDKRNVAEAQVATAYAHRDIEERNKLDYLRQLEECEAQVTALSKPVTHDEVAAVQAASGHSLQALSYACICSMVIAARLAAAQKEQE